MARLRPGDKAPAFRLKDQDARTVKLSDFKGRKVLGAIYQVTAACLRRLDKYEAGYQRFDVTVFDEDGEPVEAVTYIKTGQIEETPPSKEYLAVIQQGYRDWGLVSVV